MSKIRTPRSTPAATELLKRYAEVEGLVARVEQERAVALAAINARIDAELQPHLAEREALAAAIEPWFLSDGKALLPKGRKSLELGGCMIGSRAGRATLAIAGDEQAVVAALSKLRWAKPFLRVKTTLDRAALLNSVDCKHQAAFAGMGVTRRNGEEQFFVERVEQAGTIGG